jgi:hypothetical protein
LLIHRRPRNNFETKAKPFSALQEGRSYPVAISPRQARRLEHLTTREIAMTAIARAFVNAIPAISPDVEILKTVAVFCGVGLVVSLILASYGLDLGVDFF